MLVAGDAAAMCLAAGIWLEGVNFAIGVGMPRARPPSRPCERRHVSADGLAGVPQGGSSESFVLADHRRLRRAPELVLSDRVQQVYPGLIAAISSSGCSPSTTRCPSRGLRSDLAQERKRAGVRCRDLVRDA